MGMWVSQVPAWKELENWRAKQDAIKAQIEDTTSMITTMSDAGANYYATLAEISGQAALKRVTKAGEAQRAKAIADSQKAARDQAQIDAVKERLKVPDYVRVITRSVNITA